MPSEAETLRATIPSTAPAIPDSAVNISGFPRLADCIASVPAKNAVKNELIYKKKNLPIFPLNGAILFPGSNLPLNIFETRYIEMVDYYL